MSGDKKKQAPRRFAVQFLAVVIVEALHEDLACTKADIVIGELLDDCQLPAGMVKAVVLREVSAREDVDDVLKEMGAER